MRKRMTLLFSLFIALFLVACGGSSDELSGKYVPMAEEVVTLLNEGAYDELHAKFGETMKSALPVEQMAQLGAVIEQSGEFEEFDKSSVEEQDGYYVVVLTAKYSEQDRVYTISFNDKDEVAGLYVK